MITVAAHANWIASTLLCRELTDDDTPYGPPEEEFDCRQACMQDILWRLGQTEQRLLQVSLRAGCLANGSGAAAIQACSCCSHPSVLLLHGIIHAAPQPLSTLLIGQSAQDYAAPPLIPPPSLSVGVLQLQVSRAGGRLQSFLISAELPGQDKLQVGAGRAADAGCCKPYAAAASARPVSE
jgi:hypothetical protein